MLAGLFSFQNQKFGKFSENSILFVNDKYDNTKSNRNSAEFKLLTNKFSKLTFTFWA